MKNKKLSLTILLVLSLSLTLQACGNNSKQDKPRQTETTQESSVKEVSSTEKEKSTLNTYKEMTEFGKEKTSKFTELMKKYDIESVSTPDNMYAVNNNQIYRKYGTDYKFITEYIMNPNFESGHGAGVTTLLYEKHIDDKFATDDDKVKLINDILNSFTGENMGVDDFVKKINEADEKAKTGKRYSEDFDKSNTIFLTVNYDKNKTQLMFKHIDAYDNYKFDTTKQRSYATFDEFIPAGEVDTNDNREKEVVNFFTQNGVKDKFYDKKENPDTDYINAQYIAYQNGDKFTESYNLDGKIYNYDIKNPQSSDTLKALYKFLKPYTLNDTLNEDEFFNYITSNFIYDKNKPSVEYSKINEGDSDSRDKSYYLPIGNLSGKHGFNVSYYDGINSKDNTISPTSMDFNIYFNVPVIAEGKTRK